MGLAYVIGFVDSLLGHRADLIVDTRDLSELAGGYKQHCRCYFHGGATRL